MWSDRGSAIEVIKLLEQQLPPEELKSILLSHSKVIDAGFVGRQNENVGGLPWGVVVVKYTQLIGDRTLEMGG